MRAPTPMPDLTAIPFRVKAVGEELLVASAIDDDLGTFAAGPASVSGLQGTAESAYQSSRGRIQARADVSSLALRDVADRVLDHAAELDRLSAQRAALVARYDDLAQLVAQLGDPDAPVSGPAHLDPVAVAAACDDYERARASWMHRLASAEAVMAATLRRVMTLGEAEQLYSAAPDPADGVLGTMPPPGAGPAAVEAWWRTMTRAQQQALVAADPESIGNLDGIQAWARDRADVVLLERDLQELGQVPPGQLTAEQGTRLANAAAVAQARARMQAATDPLTDGHYQAQLYLYRPDAFGGDGEAAIAVGDLDRARDVTITVPGFGTDAGSASAQSTKAIHVEQAADVLGDGRSNATMFWIGYDAPDNLPWREVATVAGLEEMRSHDPHLTVIGHSYGSTTAALGASYSPPGTVDDLVLVGSPGAGQGIHHASETGVAAGHVWAGRNSQDPIVALGNHGALSLQSALGAGLGTDPASDGFGARRFEAESVTRGDGTSIADHLKYFDHDTESLANMAHIVDGEYADVVGAPPVHDPLLPDPAHHLGSIALDAAGLVGDVGGATLHPAHAVHDLVDGLLRGGRLIDDALGGPVDPEAARVATAPDTDGR